MRVVRQQRLARSRMRPAHHKIITPDYFRGLLLKLRQNIPRLLPRNRSERRPINITIAPAIADPRRRFQARRPSTRRQGTPRSPNKMVQRRIANKQIPRPLLPHLLRNPLPVQFLLPGRSQRLIHIQTDQISVRRSPSPRPVTQRHKFNRQFPAALRNVVVHPARISLQQPANFWRSIRRRPLRRLPHPQSPIFPVVRQSELTKNLRQIPTRSPPQQIHLPQPILRHHVTLRRHHILQRFSANPRPSPRVAVHNHAVLQSANRQAAIQPRQLPPHHPPAQQQRRTSNQQKRRK